MVSSTNFVLFLCCNGQKIGNTNGKLYHAAYNKKGMFDPRRYMIVYSSIRRMD
jgi:hypothetical protein